MFRLTSSAQVRHKYTQLQVVGGGWRTEGLKDG
jgi:hypothetical protein